MTEREWIDCTDPIVLLEFLRTGTKTSERKLRLLAVACCRRLWPLLVHEITRTCLTLAERYADGLVSVDEMTTAKQESDRLLADAWHGPLAPWHEALADCAVNEACWIADPDESREVAAWFSVREALEHAARAEADRKVYVGPPYMSFADGPDPEERRQQTLLIRDIFGPICFRPLRVDPAWLRWNDGLLVRLAQAAYEQRSLPAGTLDPVRLAVLADALEDAGGTDADLVPHLRSAGPHVRGCFAVDLLLAKS